MGKECALIDTCVLLSDPGFLVRAARIGYPILTKTVFDEVDFNKKNSDIDTANNASLIFRKIKHQSPDKQEVLPCGKPLRNGDKLFRYMFDDAPVFVLNREKFRVRRSEFNDTNSFNDARIREVAKDYGLELVTEDGGNKALAEIDGIKATIWNPNAKKRRPSNSAPPSPAVQPFKRTTTIFKGNAEVQQTSMIPGEGDTVVLGSTGSKIELGTRLGTGGEGQVYEIKGDPRRVAKIYHKKKLTTDRIAKIKLMASRSVSRNGICWPEEIAFATDGSAVGYVMQRAQGHPLQKSVFVKPLLTQRFPKWRRENLVKLCLSFLEHIEYLHNLNVLVGDINPMNVLVDGDGSKVFIVDTDSFQIEGFPCPVGTVNFSPPHLQNEKFKENLRTEEDELFAVATMLFMILVPGKPPYSQQGGESQAENIINAEFPYPLGENYKSKNVSPGPWRYLWSHLSRKLKELFHNAFRKNERVTIDEWLEQLRAYQKDIKKGYFVNDIFPTGFKVPRGQGITVTCNNPSCGKSFEMHRDRVDKIKREGRSPICPDCQSKMELARLTHNSAALSIGGSTHRTSSNETRRSTLLKRGSGFSRRKQKSQWPSFQPAPPSATSRNANKQSKGSSGGIIAFIFLSVIFLLGLTVSWWIIPVVIVALLIIGLLGPR